MTAVTALGRRVLPRGWADFFFQVALWLGFLLAYQVARGIADRDPARAFQNGWHVIKLEQRVNGLFELSLQRLLDSSQFLITLSNWTYWGSQFTVLGLALFWVYFRRNEAFTRFRNTVMLANLLGLVGYVLIPTAPPRMFPDAGFADTLAVFNGLDHESGLIHLASNPYAAMPSLHAADALIVGLVLATVVRNRFGKAIWLAWPVWVSFCVMATGNHYWLDVLAGCAVAAAAGAIVYRPWRRASAPAV